MFRRLSCFGQHIPRDVDAEFVDQPDVEHEADDVACA